MTEAHLSVDDDHPIQHPIQDPIPIDTPEMRQFIRESIHDIKMRQDERKSINEGIMSIITDLEAQGISRQAVKESLKRLKMSEDQRLERDASYALCVKALEIGEQPDLFVDPPGQEDAA